MNGCASKSAQGAPKRGLVQAEMGWLLCTCVLFGTVISSGGLKWTFSHCYHFSTEILYFCTSPRYVAPYCWVSGSKQLKGKCLHSIGILFKKKSLYFSSHIIIIMKNLKSMWLWWKEHHPFQLIIHSGLNCTSRKSTFFLLVFHTQGLF